MINVICRKRIELPNYQQIHSVKEYRMLPKGSEVLFAGPIPLEFLEKDVYLSVAQERGYLMRAYNP